MSVTLAIMLAAAIVAASSAGSAFIITTMTNKQRQLELEDERTHRDRLADNASKQTNLLITTNEQIARRTDEVGQIIEGKLDVIHTLVNSGLTAAKQSEYDAVVRELATMKEVSALHEAAGRAPTDATMAAIETTERRRAELEAELVTRRANDESARVQTEANVVSERNRRGG